MVKKRNVPLLGTLSQTAQQTAKSQGLNHCLNRAKDARHIIGRFNNFPLP